MLAVLLRLVATGTFACLAWCQSLEEAKRAFDARNYAAAELLFEKAQQASPSCDVLFYLGVTRYRLKKVDSALIAFQSAIQCDPKLISAYVALGDAYSERGNDAEALSAYTRALSLEASNSSALRGAADIYLRSQVNDKAAAMLEALVKVEEKDPKAHLDLAAVYAATGNRNGAELHYREALLLRPNSASALIGLGNLSLNKGAGQEAISLLRKATRAAPKSPEAHFLLGSAYNRMDRFAEALVALQSTLRLGNEAPEVYYHLARAYGGLGRPDDRRQALARFTELTRKSKEDTETQRTVLRLLEQAKSHIASGDVYAALARMEEAHKLRPSDDQILFRLASLQYDLQKYDLARDYAEKAIRLVPSQWLTHFLLGLIEKSSGRLPQARKSLEIAIQLKPSAAEAHNALGDVSLREHDLQRAIKSYQRAAELDPQEPAYRLNLESVRRAAGETR